MKHNYPWVTPEFWEFSNSGVTIRHILESRVRTVYEDHYHTPCFVLQEGRFRQDRFPAQVALLHKQKACSRCGLSYVQNMHIEILLFACLVGSSDFIRDCQHKRDWCVWLAHCFFLHISSKWPLYCSVRNNIYNTYFPFLHIMTYQVKQKRHFVEFHSW